jgi:hypothetical protein
MGPENLLIQMDNIMMEFGKTINLSQEKSISHMRMVINIKVAGNLVQCKDLEFSLIQMDLYTKEIG